MKYIITVNDFITFKSINVIITADSEVFTSFPAEIGNPNYDQFLEQAQLTDKQVHALKPDVWYDFPNGDN